MPTEDNHSTSSSEPTEPTQKHNPFALSYELSLNIIEGVELITNQLILGQNVTLDLFGGKISQIPEAINVDLIAESGVKASIAEFLPKLPKQSIDQIIVSNPQAYFLEYAAPVLKIGGRLYINSTKRNPFGKLPSVEIIEQLGLKVLQENAPLDTRFINQKFTRETPRNDGTLEIPLSSLKTTILEKIK
ncbi:MULTISPECIES: hypothetical protein [Kamptonema]|uniref:hypothetical protein n=1 Tax=Kamptonema TaxID=1501433 RepID=UPI0001DACD1E|nr:MULTISPECIES: hypothetical protein [Kamptonema]CBN53955.1 hypothetical protein OSCI_390003 [Kamptonema sp. PCC 6506]